MTPWTTVPEGSLPEAAFDLNTYRPDETVCVRGHRFLSEADCVLPEDWDYFLCRRCLNESVGDPEQRPDDDPPPTPTCDGRNCGGRAHE